MRTRLAFVLALIMIVAVCAGPQQRHKPSAPNAHVWGEYDSQLYGELGPIDALQIAPPEGGERDDGLESAIHRSLDRRDYQANGDTSLILRYMLQTAVSNSPDDGLGIMFGGALGSSRGANDCDIGIDLPLLDGSNATRQISCLFELALEGPSGAVLPGNENVFIAPPRRYFPPRR